MYQGFLELGGLELISAPRTHSYVQRHLPGVRLRGCHTCDYFRYALLAGGLGDVPYPGAAYPGSSYPNGTLTNPDDSYLDPATDFAPWYQPARPASADFFGFYPLDVQGMDNSTHETWATELVGNGGFVPPGRHRSREIRVVTVAIAASQEGMEEGLAWLRAALDSTTSCNDGSVECAGQQMRFFTYCPGDEDISKVAGRARDAARLMYRVEALEGPIVTPQRSATAVMARVEFTLVAGVPWWFTYAQEVERLTGNTSKQVDHVAYPPDLDTFSSLIDDPLYGTISRPPRPPLVIPEAINPPARWYRYTSSLTPEHTQRWGRGMVRLRVLSGSSERRMLRVRMYPNLRGEAPDNVDGRDWEGEFLISWMPANSELILDSALETARLGLLSEAGTSTPAGHLVHGSDGRPFQWPSLACDVPYVIHVDSRTQLGNASVIFEMATRE